MSLDVYLDLDSHVGHVERKIFVREGGQTKEISREEWDKFHPGVEPCSVEVESKHVYSANITHNLGRMASDAGLYEPLWRPEEIGITKAGQLILPLQTGLALLMSAPERFEKFNPENGWGDYDTLVKFVKDYKDACEKWPDATVSVWR
jgi:hypothetical protein